MAPSIVIERGGTTWLGLWQEWNCRMDRLLG